MKKVLLAISIGILSLTSLQAQQATCGFDGAHKDALKNNPAIQQELEINENNLQAIIAKRKSSRRAETVYTVPVVVHVIHRGEAIGVSANISDAQIASGISQLNAAYSNTNGVGVDVKVQFQLATSDPNCNATTGINRIDGTVLAEYATSGMERTTTKGATEADVKALSRWSSSDYYNVWIITELDSSNYGEGGSGVYTAGFAYFPTSSNLDGTVILHGTWGNTGTAAGGISGTIIHEMGHAMNLYHTFEGDVNGTTCPGSGNLCGSSVGDCCADTSPYKRTLYNCPTGTEACTGAAYDNTIRNYMDYSSDACTDRFSSDQKARIRATLEGSRASLLSGRGFRSPLANYTLTAATCTGVMNQKFNNIGITNVQIVGKLDIASGSASDDNGYLDKTTSCESLVELYPDTTYTFQTTIVSTSYDQKVRAWIDYNNDGAFTAGEEIFYNAAIPKASPTASASFTVPSNATTSQYLRMRVMVDHTSVSITGACDPLEYGETEDYIIYMKTASSPAPIAAFSGSSTTICAGESVTFNDASTNTPSSWAWTTTGGNPTSSTSQNQAVVYNTPGTYTVSLIATNAGGSDTETKTNYITVTANRTVGTASSTPTLCANTALTNITHATTGVTAIASSSGLPAGVTAAYAGDVITLSGTPTASGTFNYTITPTSTCGSATATGTITVTADRTVEAASSTPTLCINTALTNITHATTGVTAIASSSGLPAGVTATYAGNVITLSGTPTASG
ncbi:MAG: PKD repeat protein, partial [Glaciecola sp.]